MVIILDLSSCMTEKDLNPSRIILTQNYVKSFIMEFFDQNPISQLSVIITKNGIAEKISELGGN
jgi:transcription initiation factor TFIIH subunit 2